MKGMVGVVENIELLNIETGKTLVLDVISTPDFILDSVDWGVVKGTHYSFKYVNQNGVYVTGTDLETRNISITGWVVANDENSMENKKSILNGFFNPEQAIDLTYKKYALRFLPNSSIKYSNKPKENNEIICKFKVDGLCPDPLFKDKDEQKISAANTKAMFHFPLTISNNPNPPGGVVFGLRQPSLIVDIINTGSVSTGMRIVLKAKGTLENPKLINAETQEFFRIKKTMQAGEEIIIDTEIGKKKIQGILNGNTKNYFKYRDYDSTWLQLKVGSNLFKYEADQNVENLEVYIYYNNRYLEVQ